MIRQVYHLPSISRRNWLQTSSLAITGLCIPPSMYAFIGSEKPFEYFIAKVKAPLVQLPNQKTIPFDWSVAEMAPDGEPVFFSWNAIEDIDNKHLRFRLTSATDIREECSLELKLANTGERVGLLNIQFAHYMQPFEAVIEQEKIQSVLKQGLSITMIKGTRPFWFFIPVKNSNVIPESYLPHCMIYTTSLVVDEWKNRLLSGASLSTFGWMEGCVVDGISMMAKQDDRAIKILDKHLDAYFSKDTLVYETYANIRKEKEINNVESILPFALLAMRFPDHAMLETAIQFCIDHADSNGVVADQKGNNRTLKTEECYTIAYPLAMLANTLNRPQLREMAIANLKARVDLLFRNSIIFQNANEKGIPAYGNWARGVAWYLLGLVKTLAILPADSNTVELKKALIDASEIVLLYQQPNGLWNCFLHQPETGIETSGSAAIAAALAFGYAHKLLPETSKTAAEKCYTGLQAHFTPDGYLTGTAQVNKGGEALQRNGFRVISPYTLGFLGILDASLKI